jgi:hypothetical protein
LFVACLKLHWHWQSLLFFPVIIGTWKVCPKLSHKSCEITNMGPRIGIGSSSSVVLRCVVNNGLWS